MIQPEIKIWRESKFPNADIWDIYEKLLEEVGELGKSIAKENLNSQRLELGDVGVVLCGIADELNIDLVKSIEFSHKKNLKKPKQFNT